jgi:Na+-transporting NADH:ubiquinone oxidoreductase subunit NqrC
MKKIIAFLVLLSFVAPVPVRAGMDMGIDQVEQPLIEKQKQSEKQRLQEEMAKDRLRRQADEAEKQRLEEQMTQDFQKKQAEEAKKPVVTEQPTASQKEKTGSNWWKWALGVAVVGGIAAAAGGGGGGGESGGSSGNSGTGNIGASW